MKSPGGDLSAGARRSAPLALALASILTAQPAPAQGPGDDGRWHAGAYSYSDEMGGFRIVAVSGAGTKDDPVEIAQQFDSAGAVTLVIRAEKPIMRHVGPSPAFATGMIHMRVVATNGSGLPWIEFEFELQEHRDTPSTYGDGLSFDQRTRDADTAGSDSYRRWSRDFEPYDRLLFTEGVIDPRETGTFEFYITDFTPIRTFYLKQDPRAPYS